MTLHQGGDHTLDHQVEKGVMRIVLNDPGKRNALSESMLKSLTQILGQAESSKEVRVIVIGAEGPVFSAGHNLAELTAARDAEDGGRQYFTEIMKLCSAVMQQIVLLQKPVIADVRGVATAAGCQLVASCDLAYATTSSRFSTPGVNIGLFCSTPMVALSRNVASKHAMELLLTGDMIDAQRAEAIGLINRAINENQMDSVIDEVAIKIASKSLKTVKIGKQAFYHQKQLSLSQAYDYCASVMVENMMTLDANEGINAFLEKRPAKWSDK